MIQSAPLPIKSKSKLRHYPHAACFDGKALVVLLCLPMRLVAIVLPLSSPISVAQSKADSFYQLASDFWTWRAKYRPFTFDDVPRMEHAGGVRDWSAASLANQRLELAAFERRLKAMPADS
jgi:hypothetical protein